MKTTMVRVSEDTKLRLQAQRVDDIKVQGEAVSYDQVISDLLDFIEEVGDEDANIRISEWIENERNK